MTGNLGSRLKHEHKSLRQHDINRNTQIMTEDDKDEDDAHGDEVMILLLVVVILFPFREQFASVMS